MNTNFRATPDPAEPLGPGTPGEAPVTEQVAGAAHETVDRVAEKAARAEGAVRETAAAGERQVRMKSAEAQATTERAIDHMRQYARENPLAAAGIAFAAGLVVSRIVGR